MSKKKKIDEEGVVNLTATCSEVIQKSLLAKMKDPGGFTIPCTIGKYELKKALCDSSEHQLDALINGTKVEFEGTYSNSNYTANG